MVILGFWVGLYKKPRGGFGLTSSGALETKCVFNVRVVTSIVGCEIPCANCCLPGAPCLGGGIWMTLPREGRSLLLGEIRDEVLPRRLRVADGGLIHQIQAYRSWASEGVYPFFLKFESLVEGSFGIGWV